MSYARLWRHVSETAALLNEHGIGEDDRVAIVLANGPDMATAFLAVSAAAACVPLNPSYRADEFHAVFHGLSVRALIVQATVPSPARAVASALGIPVIDLSPIADEPAGLFSVHIPAAIASARRPALASANNVALVLNTSGTTGNAKAVALTHANLWHSARNTADAFGSSRRAIAA